MASLAGQAQPLTMVSRLVNGVVGGLAGGLLFGILMQAIGMIPIGSTPIPALRDPMSSQSGWESRPSTRRHEERKWRA